MGKDIFISYSRKDKDLVFPLVERINRELNTHCWLDMKGIESGEEFEEVIMQNIEECRVVLFMLSDASLESIWTKREVYYAEGEGKRIVPILINGDKLRGWFKFHFGNMDYIDIRIDEQKEKLIGNLKSWLCVQDGEECSSDVQSNTTILQDDDPISPEEQYQLAKDYDYGRNGKPQDDAKAAEWYQKAAEQGYASAQFSLGLMYRYGVGVPQSDTEAVKWYHMAAIQGIVSAQYYCGEMYQHGKGVTQNDSEAAKWYYKAAGHGHKDAQYLLGKMYLKGLGVTQSDTEAVKWFRKAAEQGHTDAQYDLGRMYQYGRGVPKSDTEAVSWYLKAAKKGHDNADRSLTSMYKEGLIQNETEAANWVAAVLENVVTPDTLYFLGMRQEMGIGVCKDILSAASWYRKAAEQGHADAQYRLGLMYLDGEGVNQSDNEAVKWFLKAVEQGHADAQCRLGLMYKDGKGVSQSDNEAVKWFLKAAEQGHGEALYKLGDMYIEGRGMSQNDTEVVKLFLKNAEQGDEGSMGYLSFMYLGGRGVPRNETEAVKWFMRGVETYLKNEGMPHSETDVIKQVLQEAKEGDPALQIMLSFMYKNGQVVPQNDTEANNWFQKAAKQGEVDEDVRKLLADIGF